MFLCFGGFCLFVYFEISPEGRMDRIFWQTECGMCEKGVKDNTQVGVRSSPWKNRVAFF